MLEQLLAINCMTHLRRRKSAMLLFFKELPNIPCNDFFGKHVSVYKGNAEYFVEGYSTITPVDEQWVKKYLGKKNVEKYIELFGTPDLA